MTYVRVPGGIKKFKAIDHGRPFTYQSVHIEEALPNIPVHIRDTIEQAAINQSFNNGTNIHPELLTHVTTESLQHQAVIANDINHSVARNGITAALFQTTSDIVFNFCNKVDALNNQLICIVEFMGINVAKILDSNSDTTTVDNDDINDNTALE